MSAAAVTLAPFGFLGKAPSRTCVSYLLQESTPATSATVSAERQVQVSNETTYEASVLVRRCLRGDSGAWTELVRAHHGRVYSLCYRFTGSPQDAEDLTQDVFLKLYGNLQAFDAKRGSLGVWVATLTRNHLVDHYRRSRLERHSESLDAGWDEPGAENTPISLEDARPGPHAYALQRELEREVQQALASVSPELREAVILRDLQDMDYKEIAAVLQVPEGTVKSRISRGRAELARMMSNSGGRGRKQVS